MRIEEINGNKTRVLENEFSKGERKFIKVRQFSLEHPAFNLYKVYFHADTDMEYHVLELFRVKYGKKSSLDKNQNYTHIEKYPSDSDFGVWAWCLTSEQAAEKKVAELGKPQKTKNDNCGYQSPNEYKVVQ